MLFAAANQDAAFSRAGTRTTGTNEYSALWIPIAGPFIQLAQTNDKSEDEILLALGAAQVGGVAMLYFGKTTTKRVFVRNDLVVMPMVSHGASGLALSGRF